MLDLKDWEKWFARKGYDSQVSEDGSEMIIPLNTCNVSLQADGVVYLSGYIEVKTKEDLWTKEGLWKLINAIGTLEI